MSGKGNKYDEMACKYGDPWIWGIYLTLIILSIIESYSASSREVATSGVYLPMMKQAFFLLVGFGLMYGIYKVDYNNKVLMSILIMGLGVITLASLVWLQVAGMDINGAKRAISLGFITFQPSELAKLSIVTLLAWVYSKTQISMDVSWGGLLMSVLIMAVFSAFLIRGGLTNTLLFMSISATMMVLCGTRWKKIGVLIVIFVVLVLLFLVIKQSGDEKMENMARCGGETELVEQEAGGDKAQPMRSGTWKSRINDWLDNDSLVYRPITSDNQQKMFSRIAQAHGGVYGVGIGNSRECSRLPLAFSDYIFSIIVEETGMIGGVVVMILYLWLLARALMIVRRRSHRVLPSLLIIGVACMIVFQALFHMAINVGVFPVSGQPLPMISKGGTSILVTSMAFGIMLSVSRTLARQENKNIKTDKEREAEEKQNAEQKVNESLKNEWK